MTIFKCHLAIRNRILRKQSTGQICFLGQDKGSRKYEINRRTSKKKKDKKDKPEAKQPSKQ